MAQKDEPEKSPRDDEVERGVKASLVTSLGRMAAHTGQEITYEEILNCDHEMAPGLDQLTENSQAPLVADANGDRQNWGDIAAGDFYKAFEVGVQILPKTFGKPGKIAVIATKPLETQFDLGLAYTPGVAAPCRAIHQNPEASYEYTARSNLVGVISIDDLRPGDLLYYQDGSSPRSGHISMYAGNGLAVEGVVLLFHAAGNVHGKHQVAARHRQRDRFAQPLGLCCAEHQQRHRRDDVEQ